MTLHSARIIKASPHEHPTRSESAMHTPVRSKPSERQAWRLARELVEAKCEAEQHLAEAIARAEQLAKEASAHASAEARASVEAEVAARWLALRHAEAQLVAQSSARIVELAVLLAERLLGEALRLQPERIGELAAVVLEQARGARCVRIDVSPDDVEGLRQALEPVLPSVTLHVEPSLGRGSLVVHTDLGRLDAQLRPQLERLAEALREVLG